MKKILFIAIVFCSLFGTSVLNTLAAMGDGGVARGRFQYNETNSILTLRALQSSIEECGGPPVGEIEIYRVQFPIDNIMVWKEAGAYDEPMVWRRLGTGTGISGPWAGIAGDVGSGGILILNEEGRFVYLANSCNDDITGTWEGAWYSTYGVGGTLSCSLIQTGNTLSGTVTVMDTDCGNLYEVPLTGVEISHGLYELSASYNCGGNIGTLEFTNGQLDGNTINGIYTIYLSGSWYDTGSFSFSSD